MDCGGVACDMFSGFWEEAIKKVLMDLTWMIPAIHSEIDMQVFPILGLLLSHGFLACSYLRICNNCLFSLSHYAAWPRYSCSRLHLVKHNFPDLLTNLKSSIVREAIGCTSPFSQELKKILCLLDLVAEKFPPRKPLEHYSSEFPAMSCFQNLFQLLH